MMNNSVLTLSSMGSLILNEPKYEAASPTNEIGLTIDQNQLLQITQLMNEFAQQQQQQQQQQQLQQCTQDETNPIEIVVQEPSQNTVILSPNSLAKFDRQINANNLQQLFMPTQIDQHQVHTIMLNGQPALFIPASAAMNSNILSQVLHTSHLDLNQEITNLFNQAQFGQEGIKVEPETEPIVLLQQNANQDKPKSKQKHQKIAKKPETPAEQSMVQIIQNADQQWFIINNEQGAASSDESKRLKRKACDCPNCVELKKNGGKENLTKKRTHKCHKCSKEYNKTSHLRAHLRAHDNYRPYVCDFKNCTKSFTRSDELKRHKRIHNDDRNFVCQVCKKKFLRSDHLGKHLLVHSKASTKSTPGTVGGHLTAALGSSSSSSSSSSPTIASLQQQQQD